MNILYRTTNPPKALVLAISMLLILAVSLINRYTEKDISAYVFYSVPICLSSWFIGFGYGVVAGMISSLSWFLIDLSEDIEAFHIFLYWNAILRTLFFVGISYTLHALRSAFEKEKTMAHRDFLTGVANRRTFFEMSEIEIKRAQRGKRPFTCAFIDLDGFKAINDQFGHLTGDKVLCGVAETLRSNLRATDLVARMGGDEFIVLLPDTDPDSIVFVLHKLQEQIHQSMQNQNWNVQCSVGAITYRHPPRTVDELISNADRLLLEAKKNGKGVIRHEFNHEVI